MPHKPEKLLQDIIDAGQAILGFIADRSLEDYQRDLLLRSAVERQFEIVGEALSRLARMDSSLLQSFPDSKRIISFRNIIAHGYDALDSAIVWQIIREWLPKLLDQASELIRRER